MSTDFFEHRKEFIGQNVGGVTIAEWIDSDNVSTRFVGTEEAGEKRLVYLYADKSTRDRDKTRVQGFRTTCDVSLDLAGRATAVFAIFGDHRVIMSRPIREYLTTSSSMPSQIGDYVVERVLGYGYKGVTYRVVRQGSVKTPYALKLTIAEEYENKSPLPEIGRMIELASHDRDHFPQVHAHDKYEITISGRPQPFVYIVEDFIRGQTLDALIASGSTKLTPTFLHAFVRDMLAALIVMQECGLMHDDLHAGNIMINESPAGLRPYIIDFGSTKPRGMTKKVRDDVRNLASHVAAIANMLQAPPYARTAWEESVLSACNGLLAKISDEDPMRRPDDAGEVLKHFDENFERGTLKQKLVRPFDFGNAEEVMDNSLLQELAAKSFPWKDKIESSSNLLLIGPRGCGKTTVLRAMSFNCLADAGKIDDALSRDYLAFYISCNKEFRLRFSSLDPDSLRGRDHDIQHYFNLLVLREFIDALAACHRMAKLSPHDIETIRRFLSEKAAFLTVPTHVTAVRLEEIKATITREIDATRLAIWNNTPAPHTTEQAFVADLARVCAEETTPFRGKVVYLLVDDYTERKIPREMQRALNHILFVPNSNYKSKVSSEVFGVTPDQALGTFLDQDRDYKEYNLGTLYYLDLPTAVQKAFLQEIVDKRLELSGYHGRVSDIIGPSKYVSGTLARALRREAEARAELREAKKGKGAPALIDQDLEADLARRSEKAFYHGWDTICDLCTGDVSNILELLSRMYEQCSIDKDTVTRIEPRAQHSVVESYSQQYIGKIKGIPQHGEKLFEIVNAFGSMSQRLLREYPLIDRGPTRQDPYQLIRIELDEAFVRSAQQTLAGPLAALPVAPKNADYAAMCWMLLQRYSIFIDADQSRSRRNTLASKVILRRIFCPAFGMSLSNSESFTLDRGRWEAFCCDARGEAERHVSHVIARAKGRQEPKENLFGSVQ